ncbi:hypothetical protein [Yersinia phage fHe-Yen9-03]|uniref:Uncharacterized protein n=1 Tax=Yersinia phage fHe-Yen9-03 TaxID=2052743 RepID=A0A2C9CYW6_9CAUD|nr:hypothetical protein [Yersinia phage fHe-Yen9-03]
MPSCATIIDVYSSGYPNYFTYGICVDSAYYETGDTFTLLNNNVWMKCSTNIDSTKLEEMIILERRMFSIQF